MSRRKTKLWALIAAVLIAAALAVFRPWRPQSISSDIPATKLPTASAGRAPTGPANPSEQRPAFAAIQSTFAELSATNSTVSGREQVARLRGELDKLPREAASAAIREFLATKTDVSTRADFKVGADGFLTQPTTLRVFLLDYLGHIDPAAAAEYARVILNGKDSPDEWAVALRNLALGDLSAGGRELLQQKLAELLQHAPWQQNPSIGYLESFDVAVHLGGTNLVPTLTGLVRSRDNQAVAHAAYLTLDRLTLQNAKAVLSELLKQPDLMAGREQTRANFFARGNVTDSDQRQLLENYLLNPRVSEEELQTFAGLFPNANYMISHNLLTQTVTPTGETLARQDRKALEVVNGWLADPRFESRKPQLIRIRDRLATFVEQRGGGARP